MLEMLEGKKFMYSDIKIAKNIRDDTALRESFNSLAEKTFGLNFEGWYQNGYWKDNYIPYSAVRDGRVIANVSVNPMTFSENGKLHNYIQLGTVMTDPAFRSHGLSRLLMDAVEKDWKDRTEAFYLFANDTVLDFYPRFGFRRAQEYRFFAPLPVRCRPAQDKGSSDKSLPGKSAPDSQNAVPVSMADPQNRAALERAVSSCVPQGSFDMVQNPGLILFSASQFLAENVFFLPAQNAYVIAEAEGDTLLLDAILAPRPLDPMEAAEVLLSGPAGSLLCDDPGALSRLECGFAPADTRGFEIRTLDNDDDALFVKGRLTDTLFHGQKRFPVLSHA